MFLEWWMLLVLILAAGLWSEYRSWVGYREGHQVGYRKRGAFEFRQLAEEWTEKQGMESTTRAMIELNMVYVYTQTLLNNGIISIDADGNVHGFRNSKVPAQDLWVQK